MNPIHNDTETNAKEGEVLAYPPDPKRQISVNAELERLNKLIDQSIETKNGRGIPGSDEKWADIDEHVINDLKNALTLKPLIYSKMFNGVSVDSDMAITYEQLVNDPALSSIDTELREQIINKYLDAKNSGLSGGEEINPFRGNNLSKLITPLIRVFAVEENKYARKLFGEENVDTHIQIILKLQEKFTKYKANRQPTPLGEVEIAFDYASFVLDELTKSKDLDNKEIEPNEV